MLGSVLSKTPNIDSVTVNPVSMYTPYVILFYEDNTTVSLF